MGGCREVGREGGREREKRGGGRERGTVSNIVLHFQLSKQSVLSIFLLIYQMLTKSTTK